jgi:hypothetical protein
MMFVMKIQVLIIIFCDFGRTHKISLENDMIKDDYEVTALLNLPISIQEVQFMIKKLKRNKASGIDNIPYESLMNEEVIKILFNVYSKCFEYEKTPSEWLKAVITPIPKSGDKDPHVPTNYRGISLLSCVCKGYTNILNSRLSSYFETFNIFVDEQNGFRSHRACIDHIYSITSIIRNRLANNQSTFSCFIDFQKAFDFINRDLLFYRLLLYKVDGKIYKAIKSIYKETESAVRLNGKFTRWFNINFGVRQGDALSTTLFSAFINNLATEINSLDLGIDIENSKIATLFYADDIVLVAGSEGDLQRMLDCVHNWCSRWRMSINVGKTNIIHFRKKSKSLTNFQFKIGSNIIEKVTEYKYLGVLLNEFMNFNSTAELLSGAAGRGLGSIINKFKNYRNAGYKTFTKLFHSNVCSILDYCSGVWGYKSYDHSDKIQNRAQRWFLGVHNKTALAAIAGEMGWVDSKTRRHLDMIRFWNRLIKFDDNRLVKKIFLWDKYLCKNNWCEELKNIIGNLNMLDSYENNCVINLKVAENILRRKFIESWKAEINSKPKLRTYILFKENFQVENYVKYSKNRLHRSLIAQLRSGTLPLNIEIGRFRHIELENRTCTLCDLNVIENEFHFVCQCPVYSDCRSIMYNSITTKHSEFNNLQVQEKFLFIMKNEWQNLSVYLKSAWEIRNSKLFL